MRTETLVVVFTDLKGYTAKTSAQTHQENARLLRRVQRVVEPLLGAFNGKIIKTIGDAYMAVFRSPTEAVRCATAIQDRVFQFNTNSSSDEQIQLRIALNIGEVRMSRGDVFGEPVNLAARIEGVTPAGEVYLSESIYRTMNRSDIPLEDVGEFELKGIEDAARLYRVKPFAHQKADESPDNQSTTSRGLPFGGINLNSANRVRWVRRAYVAMYVMAALGMTLAAVQRYRPKHNFSDALTRASSALEAGDPVTAIAVSGEIPEWATNERAAVRGMRVRATQMLLTRLDHDLAETTIRSLLEEQPGDASVLLLKLRLLLDRSQFESAMGVAEKLVQQHPSSASEDIVSEAILSAYENPSTRTRADAFVTTAVRDAAVPKLVAALKDGFGDRVTRAWIAARLDKLGAGDLVPWVDLALDDLQSDSCKARKLAINRLLEVRDPRAIGPLMELADSRTCQATYAKQAVAELTRKSRGSR